MKTKLRALWEIAADLLFPTLLLVLSGDLLYLYYAGAWYDPNPVIETAEFVVLWVFCGASAARIAYYFARRIYVRRKA